MPKIVVEIEWDLPDEPDWMNADNVAVVLNASCKNTKFVVRDVPKGRRSKKPAVGSLR